MANLAIFSMLSVFMTERANRARRRDAAGPLHASCRVGVPHSIVKTAKDNLIEGAGLIGLARCKKLQDRFMAFKTIVVDIEDNLAVIRLNRPEALNALNTELLRELGTALQDADSNNKVRVVVITGSEKAFAAGADIKEMSEKSYVDVFTSDIYAAELEAIMAIRKPIIAAVAGYALGGGCELAMTCDFIIAADTAKFGQPEINLGIMAGMGGSQRLTRFVGKSKAMDMNLTGRFMDAEEAERSGLVSRVVPAAKLMDEVTSIAQKIAEKSVLSTISVKEAVNRSYEVSLSEGLRFERRLFQGLFATDDQKEGMLAFLEKREPKFRDK